MARTQTLTHLLVSNSVTMGAPGSNKQTNNQTNDKNTNERTQERANQPTNQTTPTKPMDHHNNNKQTKQRLKLVWVCRSESPIRTARRKLGQIRPLHAYRNGLGQNGVVWHISHGFQLVVFSPDFSARPQRTLRWRGHEPSLLCPKLA